MANILAVASAKDGGKGKRTGRLQRQTQRKAAEYSGYDGFGDDDDDVETLVSKIDSQVDLMQQLGVRRLKTVE